MKKIFVLTGEPSGDKLASKVISKLKSSKPDIEYLSVGGEHLKALGIKSLYNLKEITYLGFTKVLLNIFKIKKKINETVDKIIEFNPDILFSVDSPDFALRVAERVKKLKPGIKTIHYVAPQVWVWREHRAKKLKKFLDHILLLFPFEKKYFEKENVNCTFVGHPLLEDDENVLTPILVKFIKLIKEKYDDVHFIFHTTNEHRQTLKNQVFKEDLKNCDVISDEKIKSYILKKSIFAVAKSGTVSLEICKAKVPSIIIYKMNFVNFFIIKMLVKVKFANIINIAADKEIIPELLQEKCNSNDIFNKVNEFLSNPELSKKQINEYQEIIRNFKTEKSSEIASSVLINNL